MMNAFEIGLYTGLALAAAVLVRRGLGYIYEHIKKDAHILEAAAIHLDQHRLAVDALLAHRRTSPELARMVVEFSERVLSHRNARRMVALLCDLATGRVPEYAHEAQSPDAVKQALNDPELSRLLSDVVRHGAVAMVLQWPDTAKTMIMTLSELATEHQVILTNSFMTPPPPRPAHQQHNGRHGSDNDSGHLTAAAA